MSSALPEVMLLSTSATQMSKKPTLYTPLNRSLGESGNNLVFLLPKYDPIVQRIKPMKMPIEQWTDHGLEFSLRMHRKHRLECLLILPQTYMNSQKVLAHTSSFAKTIIPTRLIKCYPNNNPRSQWRLNKS
ncbi:hypothetical protein HOLleu_08595 [Holothuria leucospilota]|uniref:Uncharacterized protein n=1 Tax=Holothuria leucospilota TaxID=206669 RepID=A0A9Q1CHR8_HOLLE|nr:hypothetical protein HOLleu_08595 [Holothuria leucospilota]